MKVVPDVLVSGGGALDGLAATLVGQLNGGPNGNGHLKDAGKPTVA